MLWHLQVTLFNCYVTFSFDYSGQVRTEDMAEFFIPNPFLSPSCRYTAVGSGDESVVNGIISVYVSQKINVFLNSVLRSLNIFFRLVKHLLWKLNQTQPTTIYLDVSVSIGGLHHFLLICIISVLRCSCWNVLIFIYCSTFFYLYKCWKNTKTLKTWKYFLNVKSVVPSTRLNVNIPADCS